MSMITSGRRAYVVLSVDIPVGMSDEVMQQVLMGGVSLTLDVRQQHAGTLIQFAPSGWLEEVISVAIKARQQAHGIVGN